MNGRKLNTVSSTDPAFNYTIHPSSSRKPVKWTTLLEKALRLNSTLTISAERVALSSVNHG
jgi:hypothetical protein